MAGEDYTFVTGEKKTVTHLPGTTPDGSFGPLCNNSIAHESGQPPLLRQAKNKRPKPHAPHNPADGETQPINR